jgi:hypothetical protein
MYLEVGMTLKLLAHSVAVSALVCAALLFCQPASAGTYYYSRSMYYPWAGQFPWDQRLTVNPDVISGRLLSTSTHWPALTDYAFYCSTFLPTYACHRGAYRSWERW